jgi:hypothetical protein
MHCQGNDTIILEGDFNCNRSLENVKSTTTVKEMRMNFNILDLWTKSKPNSTGQT